MPHATTTPEAKLENLAKKVQTCRKNSLRDEQRLCKLNADVCTALYKKHVLLHESMLFAGTTPMYQPKKMAFYNKKINASKLSLKESQKLARKKWELACCNTKKECLLQEKTVHV